MRYATMLAALLTSWVGGGVASGQDASEPPVLEARLLLDHGAEAIVRRGERVRIRYRTSEDAYTAVFRIDTDGRVSLLHPVHPGLNGYAAGGRDHAMVMSSSPYWRVADDPGSGYLFLVASPEPLDFSAFGYHPDFGWDLSSVGSVVYSDPYLAMDDFVAALLPDWQEVGYALDFVTYHVDRPQSYPRFLCYDCHTFRSYAEWNPYADVCSSYRIVVYDDPYYHPAYRYAGARVVFPSPIPDRPRYAIAVRGGGEPWTPIVRVRTAPAATFKETPTRASRTPVAVPRTPTSVRRAPAAVPGGRTSIRRVPAGSGRALPASGAAKSERPSRAVPGGGSKPDPQAAGTRRPAAATPRRAGSTAVPSGSSTAKPRSPAAAPDRRGATSRPAAGTRRAPRSGPGARAPAPATRPRARPQPRATAPRARPGSRPGGGSAAVGRRPGGSGPS